MIQRRVPNGTVNFTRGWKHYEEGFGDLDSEFWYGLRNIHCLTTRESVELRIDLQDDQENKVTWVYQQFSVDGPHQKYVCTLDRELGHHQKYVMAWLIIITHTLAPLIVIVTKVVVRTVQLISREDGGTMTASVLI